MFTHLNASSNTDPPLSLHTARVGSSVNWKHTHTPTHMKWQDLKGSQGCIVVCVHTLTCRMAVPGGWASLMVLSSFPLARSHIVI